jgi:hypothetical protein
MLDCGDRMGLHGTMGTIAEVLASADHPELAVRCDAASRSSGTLGIEGPALARHEELLGPARTAAGAEFVAETAARAATVPVEDLAWEIVADLDALIAAATTAGTGEEEHPAARP